LAFSHRLGPVYSAPAGQHRPLIVERHLGT
jgi:hypothetical protein